MNMHRHPAVVAASGVLCFALGVWLRFHAVAVATETLHGGIPSYTNMGPTIAASARGDAYYDIAMPLLWAGGALFVLAGVVLLLPAWRSRADVVPQRAPSVGA